MKRVSRAGHWAVSSRTLMILLVALASGFLFIRQQQQYQPAYAQATNPQYAFNGFAGFVPKPTVKPKQLNCLVDPCLALTFDDGPDAATTNGILTALESEQVKATFFLVGNRIAGNSNLVRRMYVDGDEIGNHSWSHADLTKLPIDQIVQQINATQDAVIAAGVPPPKFVRPPYGAVNPKVLTTVHQPLILWNIDPKDWSLTDPNKVLILVEQQARPGAIMILHDSHPPTAAAARQFIHDLKSKYDLVTVSQLLNLAPDAQGEYFGHPPR